MLSQSSRYAIRACCHLATAGEESWLLCRNIASDLDLPAPFLAKLLGTLSMEGILKSARGRAGGFHLARPAEEITLLQIVEPFERFSDQTSQCLLRSGACEEGNNCDLHESWSGVMDSLIQFLGRVTLADTIGSLEGGLNS